MVQLIPLTSEIVFGRSLESDMGLIAKSCKRFVMYGSPAPIP